MKDSVFNDTWELINSHYYLKDFNGLDWKAVKLEYKSKINDAEWPDDVYSLLIEMVDSLGDGHSMFLPRPTVQMLADKSPDRSGIGISINRRDGSFFIVKTIAGGSANEAGIEEGALIISIDGTEVKDFRHAPQLRTFIAGDVGSKVGLEYKTSSGLIENVRLERRHLDLFAGAATLDRLSDSNVLYLEIWNFIDDRLTGDLKTLLADEFKRKTPEGIILDLRKNLGGHIDIMLETAALFLPEGTPIGVFRGQSDQTELRIPEISESAALKSIPLAILTGPDTESAAEIFAMALRENNRAILIGQKTGGNVEGTAVADLPDGSRLVIAVSDYVTHDRYHIDGRGIEPDLYIDPSIELDHSLIGAAVQWFSSNRNSMR